MFCKKCGSQIAEGQSFCTACGAAVATAAEPVVAEEAPVTAPAEPAPAPANPVYVPANSAPAPAANWTESRFEGGFFGLLGCNLLMGLLSTITLGFAFPAMYCFKLRWVYRNTVVGGYRLKFNGTGGQLFGKYILWTLLTIVTFGVFSLWLPIKYKKWETKHVEIAEKV